MTHELAALLVGMALLAAVILQFACAGVGASGSTGRWLCVNNARLAALHPATATPTATPPTGRGAAIRPVGQSSPTATVTPFALGGALMPVATADVLGAWPTPFFTDPDIATGYPGADGARSQTMNTPIPAASNEYDSRRIVLTARAAAALAAATTRALVELEEGEPPTATWTPSATNDVGAAASPTPTPGPGTPSVTPGPSPSPTSTATETGYP